MAAVATLPIVRLTIQTLNNPESVAWAEARDQVMSALEDHGCFEIIYDGITPDLQESTMNAVKEAAALSIEKKRKNGPMCCCRGYIGKDSGYPYESVAIDDVLHPNVVSDFSNMLWPGGNNTFCESIIRFSEAVASVEKVMRKMVLEGLGVEKYFDFHMGLTKYLLRLSEYSPEGQNGDLKLALRPHTDFTFSSISLQSDVDGFEIQTKEGDWKVVHPSSSSSLTFIIGDLFRVWSNGRLYAPPHRVRVREGEIRRVAILFAVPDGDPIIEVPPELVDEDKNPVQFKPFRFMEYQKFFTDNIDDAADNPARLLLAYCGTGAA